MQKVKLICVGSLKEKFWKDAVEEYKKRLSRFCNLEIVEVAELSKLPIPFAGGCPSDADGDPGRYQDKKPETRPAAVRFQNEFS